MIGAKPPRHIPRWLARIVAGEHMVVHDDGESRGIEREGAARAWMAARSRFVEAGFRRGPGVGGLGALAPIYLNSQSRPTPAFDPPLASTPAWSRTWRVTSKFK